MTRTERESQAALVYLSAPPANFIYFRVMMTHLQMSSYKRVKTGIQPAANTSLVFEHQKNESEPSELVAVSSYSEEELGADDCNTEMNGTERTEDAIASGSKNGISEDEEIERSVDDLADPDAEESEDDSNAGFDKPVFVYGSLQHPAILFRAMYPDAAMTKRRLESIEKRMSTASVQGFKRVKLRNAAYPAAIREQDQFISGKVYVPRTISERCRLIMFEEEEYRPVNVVLMSGKYKSLNATLFLWKSSREDLLHGGEDWSFEQFISTESCMQFFRDIRE